MVKNILFTITTVIERPDKLKQLVKCLESIEKYEPDINKVAKIVIVNEYSASGVKADFIKKDFPWIDQIINKTKKDAGQSGSLNLIIDMLKSNKSYKFWLHFEESWVATKPFLDVCEEAMEMGIDQIQITEDDGWTYDHDKCIKLKRSKKKICYQRQYKYKKYASCKRRSNDKWKRKPKQNNKCMDHGQDNWPLWSLRPGMDRVSKILSIGYFNQDPKFWPVHFELEFAYNWWKQGAVKAGIKLCRRQKGHVSFSETNL